MQRKEKQVRMNEILDAVNYCEKKYGIDHIQISQVAARAGVSTRTVNRYFPEKKMLLFDATVRYLEESYEKIVERAKRLEGVGLSGRERLISFLTLQTKAYQEDVAEAVRYVEANIRCISFSMETKQVRTGFRNDISKIVYQIIEEGIQDKSIRGSLNPRMVTLMISSNINGLLQRVVFSFRTNQEKGSISEIFCIIDEYLSMLDQYLMP